MKRKCVFLLICCFLYATNVLYSQVGINTTNPNILTELEIVNATDQPPKGIMIPRMTELERNSIDVSNATLANSLMIYNITEDCYNFYSKKKLDWQSLCGTLGKATYTVGNCDQITINGTYKDKIPLNTNNYLSIPVSVTKTGSYTISAIPSTTNGYYFSVSGEFVATGNYEIRVPGIGTPLDFTPSGGSGDLMKISFNESDISCTNTHVKVEDSSIKPLYTMNTSSIEVNGQYVINKPLDPATNTITLLIGVDPEAIGSYFEITTNKIDGIHFEANGLLIENLQVVTLNGSGTPTSAGVKDFVLTSNSQKTAATSQTEVIVAYTKKKILSIGIDPDTYGYNITGSSMAARMLKETHNFGLTKSSMICIDRFVTGDNLISMISSNPAFLRENLLGTNPVDILVVGFDWYTTDEEAIIVAEYVNKGGVVILASDTYGGTPAKKILPAIFPELTLSITSVAGGRPGSIFRVEQVNHPILNGPFGDARGLQWGEDNSTTLAVSGFPISDIYMFSDDEDINKTNAYLGYPTMFVHKKKNLFYIGDGGFWSSDTGVTEGAIRCPFKINAGNYPIPRKAYGAESKNTLAVYNAVIFANALAWAIDRAQSSGINP
ncbi:MAG: hypothetical protein RL662_1206 [Bacteroidota bacterium]|jgi:hypothetical protein